MSFKKVTKGRKKGPISIRKQFTIYIIISVLILVSLSVYSTIATQKTITQIHQEYAESVGQDFRTEVASLSKQMEGLFSFLQYNASVQQLMLKNSYRSVDGTLIYNVGVAIATASQLNNVVYDVCLYNGVITYSTIYGKAEIENMAAALPDNAEVTCLGIHKPVSYQEGDRLFLTFGRRMYADYKQIASLIISVDLDFLFRKLPVDADRVFILEDGSGQVYTSKISSELKTTVEKVLEQQEEIPGEKVVFYDGNVVYKQPLPEVQCSLISVTATNPRLDHDVNYIRIGGNWIFVGFFILFMLSSAGLFYRNYVHPIDRLNTTITGISANPERKLEGPLDLEGCEELQTIGDNFTQMLTSVDEMNAKVKEASDRLYQMELDKKNSEIAYLRTQINPHFMYNTLELIRASAENGDNKVAVSASVSVGKILRYSVKGGATAPLEDEIEVTKAYISIQQARRSTPVTVVFSIPASVQEIPVMKMLLQPLVENAFIHGLDSRKEDAVLFINASLQDHKLLISVRDNGEGIDEETLKKLWEQLEADNPDTTRHLGIANIHKRIRLQYGAPYGVTIHSTEHDGTNVTLSLPVEKELEMDSL